MTGTNVGDEASGDRILWKVRKTTDRAGWAYVPTAESIRADISEGARPGFHPRRRYPRGERQLTRRL